MSRPKILFVAGLLLIGATASWATTSFTCNSGGRTWGITPGTSPIELVLMWTKSGTDCDILVMDPDSGIFIALGVGIANRFETVKFGPLPGVRLTIAAMKASGPNSKALLRGADSSRFMRGQDGLRMRDMGALVELAKTDERHKQALEVLRYYQRRKAAAAR